MQQSQQQYSLLRRILFPYSGEEPLTFKQATRVVLAWALLFPFIMSIVTLMIAVLASFTLPKTVLFFAFTFISGFCIFGILALVVVSMSNRSARIRQAWKARQGRQ
jgi:antibiotic biosynthesis monooxygenase (ABM) superfamily enzyme